MLADIHENLAVNGSVDFNLVRNLIGKDFWAIKREYTGIFGDEERKRSDIDFVQNALDTWRMVEASYDNLSVADQERVRASKGAFGEAPRFAGFDGHTDYASIARVLIQELKLWSEFTDRPMDSHSPDTAVHQRMIEAYHGLRGDRASGLFDADKVIAILDAQIHPSRR